jgi:prepilin-type N-terminal cleavage/methylation domain-containing protein
MRRKDGFTIIEIIIVIAIIATISAIMFVTLLGKKGGTDLTTTASQIGAILREAESRSMAQTQGAAWGVYFGNPTNTAPFYALFYNAYSPTTTAGYYPLPVTVGYTSATIAAGSSLSVTFSQVTGLPSVSTTVGLYIFNPQKNLLTTSSIVSIGASGVVSY